MKLSTVSLLALTATVIQVRPSTAQHFCWPCALPNGVIGKDTHGSSDPAACYDWFLKYLNNVVPGSNNTGNGFVTVQYNNETLVVTNIEPPNSMAAEFNEPGTTLGYKEFSLPEPPAEEKRALEDAGLRLPSGPHETPCARTGRANIINATLLTSDELRDFSKFTEEWGAEYVALMENQTNDARAQMSRAFGMHNVGCMYRSSGPCKLADIERGIASAFANNYTAGYVPLMDNTIMLWTPTLGPLLDAFVRDGVEFYPMRWPDDDDDDGRGVEAYSVLANPCGTTNVEIASSDPGGRGPEQFNSMPHRRATSERSNLAIPPGGTEVSLPLVPIRISRAVGADLMNEMLRFYGADKNDTASLERATKLGFNTTVLVDETIDGDRAVTIMLSDDATVHLQFWARQEEDPGASGPDFPTDAAFVEAVGSNQVNGGQPASAQNFCKGGDWTVARYNAFMKKTHETLMSPPPEPGYNILEPPIGSGMDVFVDTHFAWDCTAPHCELAAGTQALFESGSRAQMYVSVTQATETWTVYGYDPAGFGVQLHWAGAATLPGFDPQREGVPPFEQCFKADEDGTCAGSFETTADDPANDTTTTSPTQAPGPTNTTSAGYSIHNMNNNGDGVACFTQPTIVVFLLAFWFGWGW